LREELAGGDYRSLYIGWLLGVQRGEVADDQIEPPVPANLSALSTTQARLVEFLRVDRDLLDAAAEGNPSVQPTQETHEVWAAWVKSLPNSEKDDALMQLLDGEPARIAMELRARFSGSRRPSHTLPSRRTAAELLATAEILGKKRKEQSALMAESEMKRQQELAAQARRRHLDSLAGSESEIWTKIDRLIAIRQSRSYDEAVQHLKDLRDLAARRTSQPDFRSRVGAIRSAHPAKRGLLDRLKREGL